MTVTAPGPIRSGESTASWLLPRERSLGRRVSAQLVRVKTNRETGAWLTGVRRGVRLAVASMVLDQLRSAVGDDLADVLAAGLTSHSALQRVARRSLALPGSTCDVRIGRAEVTTDQEVEIHVTHLPAIELVVPFELHLAFVLGEVYAHVRDGRLTALELRDPRVLGAVKLDGTEIWKHDGKLPVSGRLTWAEGPVIMPEEDGGSRRLAP